MANEKFSKKGNRNGSRRKKPFEKRIPDKKQYAKDDDLRGPDRRVCAGTGTAAVLRYTHG